MKKMSISRLVKELEGKKIEVWTEDGPLRVLSVYDDGCGVLCIDVGEDYTLEEIDSLTTGGSL